MKAGARADLLVLDGDPVRDLANLKRIRLLVLDGETIDRGSLLKTPPKPTPAP